MGHTLLVKKNIQDSIELKNKILADAEMHKMISMIVSKIVRLFNSSGKLLFCGNGGSAADAQHLAAEFTGRYYYDRPPLYAEALHVNTSYLTAVANDYSYEAAYARLVQGIGKKDDILIGLSTSGNSLNIVNAFIKAKEVGMLTVGFTGQGGGKLKEHCDILIEIQSTDTPRIQECHMLLGHTICQLVEQELFPKS